MRFVFTGAKFDRLTSSQGGAGPDCSQGRHESCWMVIPSWRTSPTFPAQARGDLSRLTPPLFSRGWNQVFWLVGESWERIPTADWLPGEQQTKLPEFTQRGWVVSCSLSGCQKFCSWVSQPPAAFLAAKSSALTASCLFSAMARRVCLLCCGAGALKLTLIYLNPKSGWQRTRINKLLPLVKAPLKCLR